MISGTRSRSIKWRARTDKSPLLAARPVSIAQYLEIELTMLAVEGLVQDAQAAEILRQPVGRRYGIHQRCLACTILHLLI